MSKRSFAQTIPTTPNANNDDLKDCTQMLDQSIEEVRACKDLQIKVTSEKALIEQENKFLKEKLNESLERTKFLEKIKCSEFSLIKLGPIKLGHYKKCN